MQVKGCSGKCVVVETTLTRLKFLYFLRNSIVHAPVQRGREGGREGGSLYRWVEAVNQVKWCTGRMGVLGKKTSSLKFHLTAA